MSNLNPNVTLDAALDALFHGTTTWYIGLIEDTGFTGFTAGDTMASHGGWTECTDYDEGTRPEWTEGAASGQAITNSTPIEFTMNASKTIKGFFLTNDNTKGGTTGTLGPCFLFDSGDRSVVDDDVLKITATVEAEDTNP